MRLKQYSLTNKKYFMKNEDVVLIGNCMDCPHHLALPDPDPEDWFNDDDERVVCTQDGTRKEITSMCRPYNKRKECETPDWCPLKKIVNN